MNPDWEIIMQRLGKCSDKTHRIQPPCTEERIQSAQSELGKMPESLVGMLRHFNGARLFRKTGPLISIFGISTVPPLPPLQWATDWYIDKFTPAWRANGSNRKSDWAIAMMNYGGLIILGDRDMVKEWDTAQAKWDPQVLRFDQWVEKLLVEGDTFLREI